MSFIVCKSNVKFSCFFVYAKPETERDSFCFSSHLRMKVSDALYNTQSHVGLGLYTFFGVTKLK